MAGAQIGARTRLEASSLKQLFKSLKHKQGSIASSLVFIALVSTAGCHVTSIPNIGDERIRRCISQMLAAMWRQFGGVTWRQCDMFFVVGGNVAAVQFELAAIFLSAKILGFG
ncbi:hypothetical protein C8R45DRAFT_1075472 [Mycena sanguinolenta]|nr:hypothetical protein C8R45DRAFT_1075472 [Mycena sanguinolenta]